MMYKLFSRKILIVGAVGLLSALTLPLAASADGSGGGSTCTGSTTTAGGVVVCTGGGNGGTGGVSHCGGDIDCSFSPTLDPPGDGPCTSADGAPSYLSPLYNNQTGQLDDGGADQCVAARPTGQPTVTTAQALAALKTPVPTSDYKGNFLTGAPVTFSVPQQTGVQVAVPGIAGAWINATPVDFTWDFGDGHTGDVSCDPTNPDCTETHTYQSTTPDPTKPDIHTVTVTVTGTWHLYVHQPAADAVNTLQDLGTVQLTGTLNPNPRTILQVWSAQTEPNS